MSEALDLDYLRDCLQRATLVPYQWDGEDRNVGALRSKDELVAWYSQPPAPDGTPYRDRAFYCRELAHISRVIRPKVIVEFGTSLGIGTCLLHWLNPAAELITVDINTETFVPGDVRVPIGALAKYQGIPCEYVNCPSWECDYQGVDMCFIDGDHDYGAVLADSHCAMRNRSTSGKWAIVWHDYNARHPGVVAAVSEFCQSRSLSLQSRPDSDTVWVEGGY